jgi:lysophospholipase L1-like esterase
MDDLKKRLLEAEEQIKTQHYREWRRKVQNYKDMNRIAKKGQILFTGSSLMEQFPIAEYCLSSGLDVTVYNRGISGTTTDEFLAEIDAVLFGPEPSRVFINIGTNDLAERTDGEHWQMHLLKNYESILQQLKTRLPETEVYLMAYYPVNMDVLRSFGKDKKFGLRSKEHMADTNAKIALLAEKYGYQFIDVNDGITDADGNLKKEITVDGIHMYARGYESIFEALKPYILA